MEGFQLPPLSEQPLLHVDMTPDEGLPVRILEAYLHNTYCLFETYGLPSERTALYAQMNFDQGQRAILLARAIRKLKDE